MKKVISFILALVLCLAPVTAFAAEDLSDYGKIMMGDVNKDGKLTANDARTALRCAAKLEKTDKIDMLSVDTDGDNKLTAGDARAILRVSAKLSHFTNGFDGEGVPCVINTIRNNVYTIEVSNRDALRDVAYTFVISRNNKNISLVTADKATMDDLGMNIGGLKISKCGMMVLNNKTYMIMGTSSADVALELTSELKQQLDFDNNMLKEFTEMINTLIPENIGRPELAKLDGKDVYRYTYSTVGQKCQLYINKNGGLIRVDAVSADGKTDTLLDVKSISGDIPEKCFNINNYELW